MSHAITDFNLGLEPVAEVPIILTDQAELTLDEALGRLGIVPMTNDESTKYRVKQEWKYADRHNYIVHSIFRSLITVTGVAWIATFISILIIVFLGFRSLYFWTVLVVLPTSALWFGSLTTLSVFLTFFSRFLSCKLMIRYPEWEFMENIEQYTGTIPAYGQRMIAQLKAIAPDIEFELKVMFINEIPVDPFLIAYQSSSRQRRTLWAWDKSDEE